MSHATGSGSMLREGCTNAGFQHNVGDYLRPKSAPSRAIRGRSDVQALYIGAARVCREHPDRPAAHPAVWQAHHQH